MRMCDMTYLYMGHVSLIRVTWLMHTSNDSFFYVTWLIYAYNDSFSNVTWLIQSYNDSFSHVTWLIYACNDSFWHVTWLIQTYKDSLTTRSHMWHDVSTHATRLIRLWDVTGSYVWYDSFIMWHDSSTHAPTHSHVWHDSSTHATTRSYVWHDSFIRVIWHIHMCETTHPYVWHDSSTHATTHSYVWHDSQDSWMTICSPLPRTATHCNTRHHTATHCHALQHTAPHCTTLYHGTSAYESTKFSYDMNICYSTLIQMKYEPFALRCTTLHHAATYSYVWYDSQERLRKFFSSHCNTLWHTTTRCNTLTGETVDNLLAIFSSPTMILTATYCNTMPHTATRSQERRRTTCSSILFLPTMILPTNRPWAVFPCIRAMGRRGGGGGGGARARPGRGRGGGGGGGGNGFTIDGANPPGLFNSIGSGGGGRGVGGGTTLIGQQPQPQAVWFQKLKARAT